MYTYTITNNGREIEDLDPGTFADPALAAIAASDQLDMLCPPGSKLRRFYCVRVFPA